MSRGVNKNIIIYGVLGAAGLYAGYKLLSTILEGLGLKKSEEEKKIDSEIENNYVKVQDVFSPNYYLNAKSQGKRIQDVSPSDQEYIKSSIYNCIGYFYDSPQKCLSAFTTNLKYKTQVSIVAHSFLNAYGQDMLGYMTDRLDTGGQRQVLNQILSYVNSLPSGIS